MTDDIIRRQAEIIADLREEIRQLRAALKPSDSKFPPEWKLSARETQVLSAIVAGNGAYVGQARIYTAVWGLRHRDRGIVGVVIHDLRRKLRPHDVRIDSAPSRGYRLIKPEVFTSIGETYRNGAYMELTR